MGHAGAGGAALLARADSSSLLSHPPATSSRQTKSPMQLRSCDPSLPHHALRSGYQHWRCAFPECRSTPCGTLTLSITSANDNQISPPRLSPAFDSALSLLCSDVDYLHCIASHPHLAACDSPTIYLRCIKETRLGFARDALVMLYP
jgi:hypothetical protein